MPAATVARKRGATAVLNAAPTRMTADGFLRLVDLLVTNEIEAEMLAECPPVSGLDAAEAAAETLLDRCKREGRLRMHWLHSQESAPSRIIPDRHGPQPGKPHQDSD